MPIYEYQCTACRHELEALQKMSDDPLKDCPQCKQPALIKLVSAAGFQLKGTGWYVTDYSDRGKAKQQDAKNQQAAASGSSTVTTSHDAKTSGTVFASPAKSESGGSVSSAGSHASGSKGSGSSGSSQGSGAASA